MLERFYFNLDTRWLFENYPRFKVHSNVKTYSFSYQTKTSLTFYGFEMCIEVTFIGIYLVCLF